MSPGRGFGFGDRRRAWSSSFDGSPQPQPSGHQPARKAGLRRLAGVRTIRGRNENDETVVEPDLTVRYEVEEDKRQREDEELNEEEDDEDDSFETGFVYHGTVADAPVKVLYDIGADDIFIDSKFAHLRQLHIRRFGTPMRYRVAVKEPRGREAKRAIQKGAVCHIVRMETAYWPAGEGELECFVHVTETEVTFLGLKISRTGVWPEQSKTDQPDEELLEKIRKGYEEEKFWMEVKEVLEARLQIEDPDKDPEKEVPISQEITAEGTAEVVFERIVYEHGMP
uniref:Uncharacterized protein n=1 Tax=Chromera velia CCMP2878 TaxID=1169474 RepID=A0A0G4ICC4_9ALVE|eukprot:Cvel_13108.t1-p1 / transcript=Cvel_13108.t1 / gene=Cvel_13108 / organism=Chromera_velia_CCMP2878 / gene_product=hypothetical protein / transcript_product=hypothetical protein / location=Cvel_scaffold883:41739-44825(-) / protein_length=281 / sequence_SO=supercontig / SO=protein_coding / is_pseudo=false